MGHAIRIRRRLLAVPLLGLALGAVAYGLWEPDDDPPRTRTEGVAQPAASRPTEVVLEESGLRWSDHFGMELPISPVHGPRSLGAGLAGGFARTPSGALLAAVHIVVRTAPQWGPKVFESTISQQVIGPERDVLLASTRDFYERKRAEMGLAEDAPLGPGYAAIEAYRWHSYSPDVASLDLVSAGPGRHGVTVRAATRVQLHWADGDWRVLAPPGGDWGNTAAAVTSTNGYTLLPGRR
ncbi:hypothetical protein [Thermomonospora cellulosilytica]|uniref:DUF8175 domain-containing protein n=1 Tax=Thermomonospora cellulosilytica TaxID=1411118 RepID=A0A7W3RBZ4_9ACTN|nr:hypothetical protein [Thermomonospora cellulosilytica]MBA9007304.1 hypothetical protein [Thermomonospora cellulosilytica]